MKVFIAMDSFKGSVSSVEGSKAISLGIRDVFPEAEIVTLPLADGGEGTVEALIEATNGRWITKEVTGPLNDKVDAAYGILGDGKTAVIEVAAACGLPLVPADQRNPFLTTSFGVGEIILDAIEQGCRHFVIGLGGSSTNDAGVGMLQALGFRFLDSQSEEVGFGGQALKKIITIDKSRVNPILKDCSFEIACDVQNPLHGPTGAAYIFAPQKGAHSKEMVQELDEGLRHFAHVALEELDIDIQNVVGAGAAGGLGAAFAGFLQGQMKSGVELVLHLARMEERLQGVDIVITGEGKMDAQTAMGKAPLGVAQLAKRLGIPVIALAGGITDDPSPLNKAGITSCFSIVNQPMSLEEAMDKQVAFNNLRLTANQLFRLIEAVK